MKKNHQKKPSTLWNKIIALIILALGGLTIVISKDATCFIFLLPMSLLLFFCKKPIIGQEEDFPWGGKR